MALFVVALMLGASLSAVSMAAASSEEEEREHEAYGEMRTEDEEETRESEHSHEEKDVEEEIEIGSQEDDEGDLHIISNDNSIKFEKEEPRLRFKYIKNETEIKFEANDFSLIEFVDENNDGIPQKDEKVKPQLKFDEISWDFNYTKTVVENNTILTVTYYTNTTEYEIALVMRVYQRRVTESSTTWNATIVYGVDGGADEVKFDLIVSRWTWANASSQLALFMELESEVEGKVVLESASVDKDQIAIKLDSIKIKVGWIKKAKIVTAEGAEEFVDVAVAYKSLEIELEESEVELELDVYFVYPHFGENKLIHDPSIGIEDDPLLYRFTLITPEILLGTAITAIALVGVAIALSRRKEKLPPLRGTMSAALNAAEFDTKLSPPFFFDKRVSVRQAKCA